MSYKLTQAALYADGCKPAHKVVLCALADYANDKTGECWPSQTTLAQRLHLDRTTVIAAVAELQKIGYVKYLGRLKTKTMYYRLTLPPVENSNTPEKEEGKTPVENSNTPVENSDRGVLKIPTPPVENSDRGVLKIPTPPVENSNTNILYNKEDNNKESNKQASNSIVSNKETSTPQTEKPKMQTTPQVTQSQATPAAAACIDAKFSLKEIALAALAKLKAEGIDEKEAKSKLHAVAEEFKTDLRELKTNGYAGISNPKNYLTAKLYGMAKEGPKQSTPQAEEPTRLEAIFELLKKEWASQYPEVAEKIKSFELIDLHPSTENKLRAKEDAAWKSVTGSRVAYLRKTLEGTIYERVQAWRQDELKEVSSCLQRVTSKLAQLRFEPKAFYDLRKTVEDEIAELEEREKKCRAKLARLTKCTSRPNAA